MGDLVRLLAPVATKVKKSEFDPLNEEQMRFLAMRVDDVVYQLNDPRCTTRLRNLLKQRYSHLIDVVIEPLKVWEIPRFGWSAASHVNLCLKDHALNGLYFDGISSVAGEDALLSVSPKDTKRILSYRR